MVACVGPRLHSSLLATNISRALCHRQNQHPNTAPSSKHEHTQPHSVTSRHMARKCFASHGKEMLPIPVLLDLMSPRRHAEIPRGQTRTLALGNRRARLRLHGTRSKGDRASEDCRRCLGSIGMRLPAVGAQTRAKRDLSERNCFLVPIKLRGILSQKRQTEDHGKAIEGSSDVHLHEERHARLLRRVEAYGALEERQLEKIEQPGRGRQTGTFIDLVIKHFCDVKLRWQIKVVAVGREPQAR
mmetsp:Transcript_69514/g.154983  ORF Transcript_69514/g.154983 Transcript_69514/m.154983 type:complete len:243 (+) Transcript_69514:174-902(+)